MPGWCWLAHPRPLLLACPYLSRQTNPTDYPIGRHRGPKPGSVRGGGRLGLVGGCFLGGGGLVGGEEGGQGGQFGGEGAAAGGGDADPGAGAAPGVALLDVDESGVFEHGGVAGEVAGG